jgi:hypothetical protein
MQNTEDIVDGTVADWIVTGWFTPDYRPLAERFATKLGERGAPYHLWAKPKLQGSTFLDQNLMKPTVVLEAMRAYPDRTIILMDVDCIANGDISPVARQIEDVGVAIFGGIPSKASDWRVWLGLSTRVVVFHPTHGARLFAARWADNVKTRGGHEERCAALAFLSSPDVRFHYIDPAYSGRERYQLPDGVIVHESAHSGQKTKERGAFKQLLRNIERRFLRTGGTSREKTALSQIVKAS